MSELTQCNYCGYKIIKKCAKEKSWVVTKRPANWKLAGTDYFIHPKGIEINAETREEYFVAWFQELSNQCCC